MKELASLKRICVSSVVSRKKEADRIQKIVFGYKNEANPTETAIRAPLESPSYLNWYAPSKYSHQDFRIEQYLMMQAERFAPREVNPTIQRLNSVSIDIRHRLPQITRMLERIPENVIKDQPTLQDIKGFITILKKDEKTFYEGNEAQTTKQLDRFAAINPKRRNTGEEVVYLGVQEGNGFTEKAVPDFVEYERSKRHVDHNVVNKVKNLKKCKFVTVTASLSLPSHDISVKEKLRKEIHADMHRRQMSEALNAEDLRQTLTVRNRFIDPSYRLRRNLFLKRPTNKSTRPKRTLRDHYLCIHPDALLQYPSHKGRPFARYPSVHK